MSESISHLDIPGPKSRELLARRQEFVARGVSSSMNVFAAKADGAIIEDVYWPRPARGDESYR